jgi:hypothetical protein
MNREFKLPEAYHICRRFNLSFFRTTADFSIVKGGQICTQKVSKII